MKIFDTPRSKVVRTRAIAAVVAGLGGLTGLPALAWEIGRAHV